jgi:hypothetical protein
MAYNTTPTIGINFSDVGSNPTQVVGVRIDGTQDQTWQYVLFGSNVSTGFAVAVQTSGTALNLNPARAVQGADIGFAQGSASAGQYGWVASKGRGINVAVLPNCADEVALWTTDTEGYLDDAVNTTSQYQVMGTILTTSNSNVTAAMSAVAQSFPIIRRGASGV